MRARSLVVAIALAGCITNPDPREPNGLQFMQRQGYGGWIVIELREPGRVVQGELLAVHDTTLYVLDPANNTQRVPLHEVRGAALYTYESESGFGVWGFLGSVSTISHGLVLSLTFPLWVITSGVVAGLESRHVRLRYPEDGLEELAAWARFPQGMPVPQAPSKQDQAWTLTKQAQEAARAGACDQVAALDAQVRALDAGFHEVVFMRDAAIRRCFGLPIHAPPGETPAVTPAPPASPAPSPPPAP